MQITLNYLKGDKDIYIPSSNQRKQMSLITGNGMDSKFFGVSKVKKILNQ